jgi:hypothetical protein
VSGTGSRSDVIAKPPRPYSFSRHVTSQGVPEDTEPLDVVRRCRNILDIHQGVVGRSDIEAAILKRQISGPPLFWESLEIRPQIDLGDLFARSPAQKVAVLRTPGAAPRSVHYSAAACKLPGLSEVITGCPSRLHQSRPPSNSLVRNPSRASLYEPLVEPLQPIPSQ